MRTGEAKSWRVRGVATIRAGLLGVAVIVVSFALSACSNDLFDRAANASPPANGWLAMARGQVDVEGGLVRIVATRDGRVENVAVEDGDTVRQGDVLVRLDPRQARVAVGIAEAELAQAKAQAGVLKAKLGPAAQAAQRAGEAAKAGAASGQSADDAGTALAVLKAELGAAEAAAKVAQQHLEQARIELDAHTIVAPVAGRVVQRSTHVGDIVSAQAGSELFQLLPDRPRIVRAELNETYVDLVKPGMRAEVVRDSDQGPPVAAEVLRVGEVFGPSRLTDDPVERAGAHDVECVLRLDGGSFRIGQRVLVRFPKQG